MTRDEHLAWAKRRALEYVDRGELDSAVASMSLDLGKHPDFRPDLISFITMAGVMDIQRGPDAVRRWINGFN